MAQATPLTHWTQRMQRDIQTLKISDHTVREWLRLLEKQVKKDPYGSVRNAIAFGAGLTALGSQQFRRGTINILGGLLRQALDTFDKKKKEK